MASDSVMPAIANGEVKVVITQAIRARAEKIRAFLAQPPRPIFTDDGVKEDAGGGIGREVDLEEIVARFIEAHQKINVRVVDDSLDFANHGKTA
ncbi:MAG: hypothetical protein Q8Q36_01440 [bacterium]|nr:hypothetical protein [bacterium]